ncbi:hypothetical protein BKG82_27315 [Mycobacteroides chelonae]|uniref:DUF6575 domain-containing protein n=1 Tax=Mycobacteroides chelonae TaxID=1774 RepID=A0A1S1LGF3_MYCCH|nr:DUF6575 domain-containing protein [Mycobacteroides chelonae]OHU47361.1 hypothetical protein BKG82_27315 [Mycobacteroides chelonae]
MASDQPRTLRWSAPPLTDLTIDETFVYYDGPRVFTCLSSAGTRYLCAWAQSSEASDRWLCTSITEPRLRQLRSGEVELREAFTAPEHELYVATEYWSAEQELFRAEMLDPTAIPDAWLPALGFRLAAPRS